MAADELTETGVVWEGAEQLRPFLTPISDLAPFTGNPRKGDVPLLRESLREFGQVLPISVVKPRRGRRLTIVARHHLVLAATEEGWTHVAAIEGGFEDEDKARRYLLMDNRSSDRGTYDLTALHSQLQALRETSDAGLAGTGYDDSYVDRLARDLAAAAAKNEPPPQFPVIDPDAMHVDYECPSCHYGWSGSPRPRQP